MDISFLCCSFIEVFLFELFSFSTTGITCACMSFLLTFYFFSCMAIFYIIGPLLIYNKYQPFFDLDPKCTMRQNMLSLSLPSLSIYIVPSRIN